MSFYKLWRSSGNKKSSNRSVDFDLFAHLCYMSAISASGADRSHLFAHASRFPSPLAHYFAEIDSLAQRLNYDYGEACRIVGEAAKHEEIRSFLLRFSAALSSGEEEEAFLKREAQVQAEAYSNRYERDLERLRGWTYAWAGLIVSTALIIIVTLVSTMIFPRGANVTLFIMGMMVAMLLVSIFGAWFIYQVTPYEVRFLSGAVKLREGRLLRFALKVLLPAAIVLSVAIAFRMLLPAAFAEVVVKVLNALLPDAFVQSLLMAIARVNTWIIFLFVGLIILPIGVIGMRSGQRVDSKDKEVGTFFRSLGGITTAIGMTVKEGLDRLDKRSLPSLMPDIERLCHRLGLGLDPQTCWQYFCDETGSETVRRSTEIFYRAINLGGDAEKIGERASFFATNLSLLRARRRLISSTFRWLSIGMHAIVVALLVFIVALVGYFAQVVQALEKEMEIAGAQSYMAGITGNIFLFNFSVAESFPLLIIPAIIVLSVVDAFVPQVTEGGHPYKFFFYLGLTLVVSGLLLGSMPVIVNWVFYRVR